LLLVLVLFVVRLFELLLLLLVRVVLLVVVVLLLLLLVVVVVLVVLLVLLLIVLLVIVLLLLTLALRFFFLLLLPLPFFLLFPLAFLLLLFLLLLLPTKDNERCEVAVETLLRVFGGRLRRSLSTRDRNRRRSSLPLNERGSASLIRASDEVLLAPEVARRILGASTGPLTGNLEPVGKKRKKGQSS
jgi:hypothetical protein